MRFVHLHRDAVLGVPAHQRLRFGDRLAQRTWAAAIEPRVPEQRDGAPGVVDGPRQHRRPAQGVARAAVATHQRIVAQPRVGVDRGQVVLRADGHAAGAVSVRDPSPRGGRNAPGHSDRCRARAHPGIRPGRWRPRPPRSPPRSAGRSDGAAGDRAPSSGCVPPAFAAAGCRTVASACSPRK